MFPAPPLLPREPISKAQARIWIDFANTKFVPVHSDLLRNPDSQKQKEAAEELYKHLQFIDNEGLGKLSGDGPYWFGESISLVDLTYYPWFERWPVIEHYRDFKLLSEFPRLQRWRDTVSQRDSVKAIANSKEFYLERYAKYVAVSA